MSVKLGLFLSCGWSGDRTPWQRFDELCEQIRVARDAGFESIWVPQHFVAGPGKMLQSMPLMGRLTAEAAGMRIGTSIMLLPMLNPVQLAEEMATLDWLTDGRMILGVGLGYIDREYAAMQAPKSMRVGRFTEAISVLRKLWTGERVSHAGKHFPLEDVQIGLPPKQDGGPPILIGAGVDAAIRRAAQIGDGWLITFATERPRVAEQLAIYRAERAAAGLPPAKEQTIGRECYVGASMADALADADRPLLAKYAAYSNYGYNGLSGNQAEGQAFMKDRFLVGDMAFVRDEMQRYRETLGVDLFRLRMDWDGLGQDKALKSIERAGRAAADIR